MLALCSFDLLSAIFQNKMLLYHTFKNLGHSAQEGDPRAWALFPGGLIGDCVCVCVCVCAQSLCGVDSAISWTVACQAPWSMGFSRQEFWSR